jgi:hypothetical protein
MNNADRTVPAINKGGRPRLSQDSESIPVSTRLPERVHDKLQAVAERHGESVASTMRRLIILNLK